MNQELKAYLSVLFHVAVFTFVIVTTTVVLHEYGHFFVAQASGCTGNQIVLLDDKFETYTTMDCPAGTNNTLLELSSFTFIIPFALILFLLSRYEKYHAFVVLGFNMVISSSDFGLIFSAASYLSLFAGAGLIIYGENLLVNRYIALVETVIPSSQK